MAIDFGESACKAAYFDERAGRPTLIRMLDGAVKLASVVNLSPRAAKSFLVGQIVTDSFIAGSLSSSTVIRRIKQKMASQVESDQPYHGHSAIQISGFILKHLREAAERELQHPVQSAVITHPAYFPERAQLNLRMAGEMAGLRVRQLVPDPTAAAWRSCVRDTRSTFRALVCDWGGGGLNLAVVEKHNGELRACAMDGDLSIGGQSIDDALATQVFQQFRDSNCALCTNGAGIPRCPTCTEMFDRLTCFVEQLKVGLSTREKVKIPPGTHFADHYGRTITTRVEITRTQFEDLIHNSVELCVKLCRRMAARTFARNSARHNSPDDGPPPLAYWRAKSELHAVILVGGSSLIPLVQKRLCEEWGSRPDCLDPIFATALGAATLTSAGTTSSV